MSIFSAMNVCFIPIMKKNPEEIIKWCKYPVQIRLGGVPKFRLGVDSSTDKTCFKTLKQYTTSISTNIY